jgi:hypothetical protein
VGVTKPVSTVRRACWRRRRKPIMNDLLFIGITVAFFAAAALYAVFCEKVR